jgi:membrane complex biogenesis BtpA family protein
MSFVPLGHCPATVPNYAGPICIISATVSRFSELFAPPLPISGMIHLPPLPDYDASPGIDAIVSGAIRDLQVLESHGVSGVLVENEYDRPHRVSASDATVDVMTRVTSAVVSAARQAVVGCEILLNDPRASLDVAVASGARFIRSDYFVDRMTRPEYGEFDIDPEGLLQYRDSIGAGAVLLLADIQVKYATMLNPRSLAESAQLATAHGADAIVVSGSATGDAPLRGQLKEAKQGAGVPVLLGSGLTPDNAAELLPQCDGAIVGTALMRDGHVDDSRSRRLMQRVNEVRAT